MGRHLGVLGGTFDPPHIGHLVVAQDALEALGLDRLLVVPAPRPPHREPAFPADDRLEMTRQAFGDHPRIFVSCLEMDRPGPSYTVDTLEEVRREEEPEGLTCVIGADQLRELDSWHRPERLTELARLAVMTRPGEELAPPESMPDLRFNRLEVTRVELSSTRIRERLREGRSVRYLVPEAIRARVEEGWDAGAGET